MVEKENNIEGNKSPSTAGNHPAPTSLALGSSSGETRSSSQPILAGEGF